VGKPECKFSILCNKFVNKNYNIIIRMKDLSVSNDVFYHSMIKNDISKIPLTLDHIITLLPLVYALINSKYDVYVKNGVRTAWNILKCIYDVKIINNYIK
jgi:hypothetical protein